MPVNRCLPLLPLLLAAAAAGAWAESPMPDPIAPAVLGRPLDQIRSGRHAKAEKRHPGHKVASGHAGNGKAVAKGGAGTRRAASRPATATLGAAPQSARAAAARQATAAASPDGAPLVRPAKRALDDRADTRVRADDVGKGTHFARKPLGQGAYFDDGNRAAVQRYYAAHPPRPCAPGLAKKAEDCLAPGQPAPWQIGQALPREFTPAPVPAPVLGLLPKQPPGYRYVQVAGDILLIGAASRMVVDGINAPAAR